MSLLLLGLTFGSNIYWFVNYLSPQSIYLPQAQCFYTYSHFYSQNQVLKKHKKYALAQIEIYDVLHKLQLPKVL